MKDRDTRDRIYADVQPGCGDFVFDDAVAAVFPDMIRRSVPGYPAIINMIQLLAQRYAQPQTTLIDLGCSLGASTTALAMGAAETECRIVGVDNAPAMIARARSRLADRFPQIDWRCEDIRQTPVRDASLVAMNFTLQFLPPEDRSTLLRRIRDGLCDAGVLILSEKIAGEDAQADVLLKDMHHAFKRSSGYSELEISRKRNALENVLVAEPLSLHRERLAAAGFRRVEPWFQCFNFLSLVAFR